MRLSKQTEYGLRAVVQLARQNPRTFTQARDLAKEERLPNKFLEAILLSLRRGGLLESKIGRDGGYRLARDPKEIRVGEIIRRLEGRLSEKESVATTERSSGELAVHLLNEKLTEATEQALDNYSLQELLDRVNRETGVSTQMYYI